VIPQTEKIPMIRLLILYLGSAAAFFAADLLWLGVIARDFYRQNLGHLLAPDVRWGAALLFYAIFILGVVVLAVLPGLERDSFVRAALLGGFLGVVGYAAFDLTCLALFKDFPVRVVFVDMIWGCLLSGFTASVGFGVGKWLGL
jgi:uncharacterized membrane protein